MVTDFYMDKIRRAVRRGRNQEVELELADIIEECRRDLISLGVLERKANDEADPLILGAVRCFVRWKFGIGNEDAAANREDYMQLRGSRAEARSVQGGYVIIFSLPK